MTVGMPRTIYRIVTVGFSSTLSLPTVTLPTKSPARESIAGPIARQGPHHSAQKSTSTGVGAFKTSASKLPSVNVTTLSEAIAAFAVLSSGRAPAPTLPVVIQAAHLPAAAFLARLYTLTYSRAEVS